MKQFGKILLYGLLFNAVFVGLPWTIDALKADTSANILTRQVNRDLQAMFAKNPPEFVWTDPAAIYALALGWVVLCGMFIAEARRQG